MAVARMKAVTIIGDAELRDPVVEILHALGAVQLAASGDEDRPAEGDDHPADGDRPSAEDGDRPSAEDDDRAAEDHPPAQVSSWEQVSRLERRLSELSACLAYMNRYDPVVKGLVESFLAGREEIDPETWDRARHYDVDHIVAACAEAEARLPEIRAKEAELAARRREIEPLAEIALNLKDLEGTETTSVFFGRGSRLAIGRLEAQLAASGGLYHLQPLGEVGRQQYFMVVYPKDDASAANAIRAAGIEPASVPEAGGTALECLAQIEAEITALEEEKQRLAADGAELAKERKLVQAAYDHLLLQKQRVEGLSFLGRTERTFVVRGWCPAEKVSAVQSKLEELDGPIATEFRDPRADDKPPVILKNKPLAAPFQIVTNIFGWPSYSEVDPTPVLAPFFALFFALALTDAGYGLIMMAYCLWMIKRPTTPRHAHGFFRLLAYGGAVTVVVGAMTGGWFGDSLDYLPAYAGFIKRAKDAVFLFDPVRDPMTLMVLSLGLGIVHLLVGVGVKMYRNILEGRTADALMDQGLWILFIPSLVVFGTADMAGLPPAVGEGAKYVALAAAAGLVLTQGRASKNIIARLGGGLYSLYGLVGYLSDTLSYTRLLALGLATASLGMAINQIAMMVRPVPFIGIVLMLAIMAFGHGLSLLINIFGAFIHSGRLQFVEFFSKFFDGGGKPFRPFAERPKFTQLTGS